MSSPVWYPLPGEAEAAGRVAEAFVRSFGREPDGVWSAPGRVNVIGEHVDYNGGLCLPFALPHRTFVALGGRDDDRVRVRSAQLEADEPGFDAPLAEIAPGTVDGWAGYVVGVPWALRELGFAAPGFDAAVDGHVPLGAGLSSSAALECAVAIALDDVAGLGLGGDDPGRAQLAAACVRAENDIAGAPTGGMDQAAALRCRAGHALLLDCRDFDAEQVPFDLAGAGLELLVMDTRAHHTLTDGQYGSRRQACEDAARLLGVATLREVDADGLAGAAGRVRAAVDDPEQADEMVRRVRHVVTEIDRVRAAAALLRADRIRELGPLLDASHASLRDDFEVSCAELDLACSTAVETGALGARMTGGGFGGSAIALVDPQRTDEVARAVTTAFAVRGFAPPAFLRAVPSASAARRSVPAR